MQPCSTLVVRSSSLSGFPPNEKKGGPMLTVSVLLLLAALVLTVAAAMNRAPLWTAVLVLLLLEMVRLLPVG